MERTMETRMETLMERTVWETFKPEAVSTDLWNMIFQYAQIQDPNYYLTRNLFLKMWTERPTDNVLNQFLLRIPATNDVIVNKPVLTYHVAKEYQNYSGKAEKVSHIILSMLMKELDDWLEKNLPALMYSLKGIPPARPQHFHSLYKVLTFAYL